MEAASRLATRLRREAPAERELQRLRPFGEAYLMRHFGDRLALADAEDAVSDVILRLHRQFAAGRPPENLQGAFLTGCRNAAIDRLRRRARKPTVGLEAATNAVAELPGPEEEAERRESSERTREVLARLRPRHRLALMLRFGAGMTVPEVAARMAVSQPAAKNVIARAIDQARRHFEALEERRFCPEIQGLVREALIDGESPGPQDDDRRRALDAHLAHCGACKSFLADLHRNLHELGSGALLAAALAQRPAPVEHLARLLDHAAGALHSASAKARLAAYKLGGLGSDGSGAGALAGTGQKVAALCAGAATTTCLATGIVGPGVGALASHDAASRHPSQRAPAHTRKLSTLSASPSAEAEPAQPAEAAPSPNPESQPESSPQRQPEPEPAPTPSEQGAEEFGLESTAPPPQPEPAPQSAPSAAPARSSGGSGGGGGESFGFGG